MLRATVLAGERNVKRLTGVSTSVAVTVR